MADLSSFVGAATSSAVAGLRALIREAFLSEFNRPIRVQVGADKLGAVPLLAQCFHAKESICAVEPLRLEIVGLSAQNNLSPAAFMGQPVRVQMVTDSGQLRAFSAIITQAQSIPDDGSGGQPWLLEAVDIMTLKRQTRRSRIIKSKSVVDAIEVVLKEWVRDLGGGFEYNFDNLQLGNYSVRGSFFQIDESDTDFIQRHCRKHGIGWAVRTKRDSLTPIHTLVFFDASAKFEPNAAGAVRYHADSATEARDVITVWSPVGRMRPGVVEGQSWDYKVQRTSQHQSPTVINYGEQGNRVADSLLEAQIHPPRWADDDSEYSRMGDLRMQYHEMQAAFVKGAGSSRDAEVLTWIAVEDRPGVGLSRGTASSPYSSANADKGSDEYIYLQVEHWGQNNLPKELDEWVKAIISSNGWEMTPPNIGHYQDKRRYTNTFIAVEFGTPVVPEFIPERDWPRLSSMIGVIVCPEGEEVHCDEYARVFVRIPGLRIEDHEHAEGAGTSGTPADSMPIRVAMPAATAGGGMLQLPRKDDEVLITFIGGDPDKPVITHSIASPVNTPTSFHGINTLPGNRYLSGNRSQEIAGDSATHVLHDNTPQQTNVQIHADQTYSQLTMGYITTPRSSGRANPRGEGFELRTDAHGAIRAKDGLLITTEARNRASGHITDMGETVQRLSQAHQVHSDLGDTAQSAKAQETDDQPQVAKDLATQNQAIQGNKAAQDKGSFPELADPQLVVASPTGIATTTAGNTHQASAGHHAITAHGHISLSTTRRLLGSARQGIRLFAHKLGIKMIAAIDRVLIQAQQDGMDVLARKDIRITSTEDTIYITANKKIVINGGGSQSEWAAEGITHKTNGAWLEHAASHDSPGPDNVPPSTSSAPALPDKVTFVYALQSNEDSNSLRANTPYDLYKDGAFVKHDMTDEFGQVVIKDHQDSTAHYKVVLPHGAEYHLPIHDALEDEHHSSNIGYRTHD